MFSRLGSSQSTKQEVPSKKSQLDAQITKANIVNAQVGKSDGRISFTVTGLGKIDPQHIVDSMKEVSLCFIVF